MLLAKFKIPKAYFTSFWTILDNLIGLFMPDCTHNTKVRKLFLTFVL